MLTLDAWLNGRKSFAVDYYEVAEDTAMFSARLLRRHHFGRIAPDAHTSQQPDRWHPRQVEMTRSRGAASGFAQTEAFLRHPESKRALLPLSREIVAAGGECTVVK
jgi:hypothetical protein